MYIFELIANALKSKKYRQFDYNESPAQNVKIEDTDCTHCFMPLDSTNEMFACKYCGLIVSKERLKDMNIFRN